MTKEEELEKVEGQLDALLSTWLLDKGYDVAVVITALSDAVSNLAGGIDAYGH